MNRVIRVAVTGAAGQIGYSLLPRIAAGEMFGVDQPVELRLIEIPQVLGALKGVEMELDDCAFPLLRRVVATADLDEGFDGAHWVLLLGGVPRKEGMERRDLLGINGKIFVAQGAAIARASAPDVRVLVVANPCNTNCLIAMRSGRPLPHDRWFAMTRIDENRAKVQLAHKADVPISFVSNVGVWGNHSATMYPDFTHAKIRGTYVPDVIRDRAWLEGEFLTAVQQRGTAILKTRGTSSVTSAAHAAIETVRSLCTGTPGWDWHSVGVCSDGSYGIDAGLISSFPVRCEGASWEIVKGLQLDGFARAKIAESVDELRAERDMVRELLA